MNLVLIGYRGTGKTTISEWLHDHLNMPVFHMDEMLESRLDEKIASYVAREGWDSFREEECLLVEELAQEDNAIIDTGGGVVVRETNVQTLKQNGFFVWLEAPPAYIAQFIGNDPNRPSLTGTKSTHDEIEEVLAERTPLYQAAADFIVDSSRNSMEECGRLIAKEWKRRVGN